MGHPGSAHDNAAAESFFATLQKERLDRRRYHTRNQARRDIATWIDGWYNPRRRHSTLDDTNPINYENNHHQRKQTVMCLSVCPVLVGARHIDHVDRLRAGATERVSDPATIDVDSTICEVSGKPGRAPPTVARDNPAITPSSRPAPRPVIYAAPACAAVVPKRQHPFRRRDRPPSAARRRDRVAVRADAGFFCCDLLDDLDRLKVHRPVTVPLYDHVKAAIDDNDRAHIDHTDGGEAHVAETVIVAGRRGEQR